MLKGKNIVVGVTGSIAAYKVVDLVSTLLKEGCEVYVLMTENATRFINPITFETLTNHKCLVDTFDRHFDFNIEHVALAKKASAILVAPASADVIGKIANGIADDMLTTTIMASPCPKLIAPAMNTGMYDNPILRDNLEKLKKFGYHIIEPAQGRLACGTNGHGRLPEVGELLEHLYCEMEFDKDMRGKKVLVTAGPTREHLDPIRYITNRSSGKMGYAIAKVAMRRGADVTLIAGPTELPDPIRINTIHVETAGEMFDAVKEHYADQDIIVKAAAVADYAPEQIEPEKIKKSGKSKDICLRQTDDILAWLGQNKGANQYLCGFAMETENLMENAKKKLIDKKADMIVANNVAAEGAGFGGDTNVVSLIMNDGVVELPVMTKKDVAIDIFDTIIRHIVH